MNNLEGLISSLGGVKAIELLQSNDQIFVFKEFNDEN